MKLMDELIAILDAEGKSTGKTELKSHAHRMGLFHATVHIWFYTSDGKVLLQQRGRNKATYPLLWDVSVAGHVITGEHIETAALREIDEEIGLKVNREALQKIGVFKSIQKHGQDVLDCEFHHTFLSQLHLPIAKLKKQESEIEFLKLITVDEFSKEIQDVLHSKKYVPHTMKYYITILTAIKKSL